MAQVTKIAWTDATFNPWRGCVKVSDGCAHCYAEGWAKRTGKAIWGKDAAREFASASYWKEPLKWNKEAAMAAKPFRVFCASLADVCEDREDLVAPRAQLMKLIEQTPNLTWLLCTKRPENFTTLFGRRWTNDWPRNVWAMTTAENQAQADRRIPELLKVPAVVLGVSYEPALGPVKFAPYLQTLSDPGRGVDWVIVGGESGGQARPFDVGWAQDVVRECRAAGAAAFVKQLGAKPITDNLNRFDFPEVVGLKSFGTFAAGAKIILKDNKGGDPTEWPEDLRVREFPRPLVAAR